jgi:hypothetical protein
MGVLGDGPADHVLRGLHVDMQLWCKQNRLGKPVGKMFSKETFGRGNTTNAYPELNSSYKAASVKVVAIFLAHRCSLEPPGSMHFKLVCTNTWAYADYLHTLDSEGRFLSIQTVVTAIISAPNVHTYRRILFQITSGVAVCVTSRGHGVSLMRPLHDTLCYQ